MEQNTALLLIRIVGVTSAICAALGIAVSTWATVSVVRGKFDEIAEDIGGFRKFCYLFSGISIVFNIFLGLLAAQLLFSQPPSWWVFLAVFSLPILHMLNIGRLWRSANHSVAAATGIGNAGLTFPFFCFLPIWGPIALWAAN